MTSRLYADFLMVFLKESNRLTGNTKTRSVSAGSCIDLTPYCALWLAVLARPIRTYQLLVSTNQEAYNAYFLFILTGFLIILIFSRTFAADFLVASCNLFWQTGFDWYKLTILWLTTNILALLTLSHFNFYQLCVNLTYILTRLFHVILSFTYKAPFNILISLWYDICGTVGP